MPHPRTIAVLLWAGPVYVVGNSVWLFVHDLRGYRPFELRDTSPYLFAAITTPLGILLVAFSLGVWFSLRNLAGRDVPIATARYLPFGELRLRLDEILPAAAGLTTASPALQYILPHVFTTADLIHLVTWPSFLSGPLIAWVAWNLPVSRLMKIFQLLTPILIVLVPVSVQRLGVDAPTYTMGFVVPAWMFATTIWFANLMHGQSERTELLAESRGS